MSDDLKQPVTLPDNLPDLDTILAEHFGEAQPEPQTVESVLAATEQAAEPPAPPPVEAPNPLPPSPEPQAAPSPPAQPVMDPEVQRLLANLQEKERLLDQRLQEAEQARQQLEPLRRYEEIDRLMHEQDAQAALERMGVDYRALSQAVLEGRGVNPNRALEQRMQAEIDKVRQEYDERLQFFQEREQQRLVAEARTEIRQELAARSPLLTSVGEDRAIDMVWNELKAHHQRTGRVPTYDEVIPKIEAQYRKFLETVVSSDVVRRELKLGAGSPPGDGQTQQVTAPPTPTLSNRATAVVATRQPTQPLPEDREAAIDAILAQHR